MMTTTIFDIENNGKLMFIYLSHAFSYLSQTTACIGANALPTAISALHQTRSSTIFTTEQSAEEAASQAILEQHVKLSEKAMSSSTTKSRRTTTANAQLCRAFKYC